MHARPIVALLLILASPVLAEDNPYSEKSPADLYAGKYAVIDGVPHPIPDMKLGSAATVRRIVAEGMNRNQVMNHLEELTSDIGPRLTGSAACDRANEWAAAKFRSWGLSAVQNWEWGTVGTRFDRGPSTGRVVDVVTEETVHDDGSVTTETTYETDRDLEFSTLAWTRGTDGPTLGHVVKMPTTMDEYDAVADRLDGAWVMLRPDYEGRTGIRGIAGLMRNRHETWDQIRKDMYEPPAREPDVEGEQKWTGKLSGPSIPGGEVPAEMTVTFEGDSAAGTFGVPGFAVSDMVEPTYNRDTETLSFVWKNPYREAPFTVTFADGIVSGSTPEGDDQVFINLTRRPGDAPEPVETGPTMDDLFAKVLDHAINGFVSSSRDERVWTTSPNGWRDLQYADVPQDTEVAVRASDYDYINSRLADGLDVVLEFDLDHQLAPGPIPCYNTIAEIPGTELPDEVVIVSAHLDSWDGPGSQGTTDNGTGSCVMLEAARILMAAKAKPKRTIRFILWTGEEQGLLGSKAYVEHLKGTGELDGVSACFVDDGGTNYQGGLRCIESMSGLLAASTAPINGHFFDGESGEPLIVNVRINERMPRGGGSDHASFNRAGIPGFFWDEVGRAKYRYGWHTQNDTFDLAIPEYLKQSATCTAVTAYNLACAPTLLPRQPQESESDQGR